jgi:hypothetical protein
MPGQTRHLSLAGHSAYVYAVHYLRFIIYFLESVSTFHLIGLLCRARLVVALMYMRFATPQVTYFLQEPEQSIL